MAKWTAEEIDYLRNHYLNSTDADIAAKLNKPERAVINKRVRMGLYKNLSSFHDEQIKSIYTISDDQKREMIQKNFRNSRWYNNAVEVLLPSEVPIYEQKWIEFIASADELTPIEQESLHIMILMSIRIDRYNKIEKASMERAKKNDNPDLIRIHQKEINECTDRFNDMQKNLYATREQRIKEQGQRTLSFLTLLREMADKEKEARLAREAAAMEYIADKEEEHYIQEQFLITSPRESGNGSVS